MRKARGIKRKPNNKLTHIILREPVTENVTIRSRTDQAIKSIRRMPWHQETTKDVTSCEKLRGGANIHRSADIRMGKPTTAILQYRILNKQVYGDRPAELKHLSRRRKRNQKRFPKQRRAKREEAKPIVVIRSGLRTAFRITEGQQNCLGRQAKEGKSPVNEILRYRAESRVPPDTWNPVGSRGDHPPSLNTT